jgi:ABC-2 type transport system permease protein
MSTLAPMIAAERIKLSSTRSPWWCAGIAAIGTAGLSALIAVAGSSEGDPPITVASTQFGYIVGMAVVMVMAALAATSEYSVGTIRTTFLAAPRRGVALTAKAVVVAGVAATVGLLAAFGAWALSALLLPTVDLSLAGVAEWRQVAGVGAVHLGAAVVAVAVGILVRHTAGAVSIVLVWSLMAEQLFQLIPGVGQAVQPWLPFSAAKRFLMAPEPVAGAGLLDSPWTALAYFGVVASALLAVAIGVAKRRDA